MLSNRAAWPSWLAVLAVLAVGLAGFYYFTGEASTLPLRVVPHLEAQPLTLDSVAVGARFLPVQVSGFVVSLTHDVAGPFTQPVAAGLFLGLLAVVLVGWVAVVSTLARGPFIAGMVPVIFLLMSLNTESLGVFNTEERYFLYLLLGLIGGGAFVLHAFAENLALRWRAWVMGGIVLGLSLLLFSQSQLSTAETALQLAAYATPGGAVLVALLVLWVGVENVRALLWFNTQAEEPSGRFGLVPFVAASSLYVGVLLVYVWNGGELQLFPGVSLDPLLLLLPAVLAGGLGLRLRARSYAAWVPFEEGAAQLYPLLVMGAAGALAYAFATANTPLLVAARTFTGTAFALLGSVFLLYVLINFSPLIKQRLRVYRVVFEPRRLPFYPVYILALGGIIIIQARQGFTLPDQVQAGQYNNLGDLTRQQSEAAPDDLSLAGLAERYYAESGDVLYRANVHAEFGRAALYRFRQQRQNEINALRRSLLRGPNEKATLRLATLYNAPDDLFEGLDVLRRGLKAQPRSAALAGDLAQLFTQTALTDSVAFYLDKAEQLAPGSYASRTNQLGFLLNQNLLPQARTLSTQATPKPDEPALASNVLLLQLRTAAAAGAAAAAAGSPLVLDDASFARLYHNILLGVARYPTQLTPALLKQVVRLANEPANANYYEQLQFLQALARHALGQEQAARQVLLPLAAGTTATAGYYQQLLGFWQLQQGQYATAADQLAFATTNGAPASASIARIYALAASGRVDSAFVLVDRIIASPDSAQHRMAQDAKQLLSISSLMPNSKALVHVGDQWLAAATAAEAKNAPAAAQLYQRIVREAPFNEPAVLAAGRFYTRRRNYPVAYEALRAGLAENPQSLPLLKAYVLAAADAGLTEYAAGALTKLRQQLPPAASATLAAEYARHQAARAAAGASFAEAPAP